MTEMFSLEVAVGAVGSAILHSIWQGALVAVITAVAFRALRAYAASVRYTVACFGLAALTVAWLMTAISYVNHASGRTTSAPAAYANGGSARFDFVPARAPIAIPSQGSNPESTAPFIEHLQSWTRGIVPFWFLGVLALSIRLAFGWASVGRIRRAAHEPVPDAWPERVNTMAKRLGIHKSVRVVQSAVTHVPMLVGWLRPVILIPTSVMSGLTTAQLEAVIAHELAHVRRHDYIANIAQSVAEIVLFYHPACWWISRQIRAEREHCCDDIAAAVCGSPILYAGALADLETLRSDAPFLSVAATDGILLRRIRRLVSVQSPERRLPATWAAVAVPATVTVLVVLSITTPAQEIPSDKGVVQGRILDARSGRPIAGATVELSGANRSAAAATDAAGRYEVEGLDAGDYRVEARAPGYVSTEYGRRDTNERGAPLAVRGGRATTGVDLRLEAAGLITGRVFDERGEGLSGVEVELLAERLMPDGTRLVGVGFAQTEAQGVFKVADLAPGDYYVRAYVSSSRSPSQVAEGRRLYRSTFYPGVDRSEYAQRLSVSGGQELFGVDFPVATARARRVSGVVVDPARGELPSNLQVRMRGLGLNSTDAEYSANVVRTGRFEIIDVIPGEYLLSVVEPRSMTSRWISATRSLLVEDDVSSLELRARVGARVTGRIVRDTSATRALDPSGVSVTFEHRMGTGAAGLAWSGIVARGANGSMRIGRDGVFTIESPGGPSRIRVSEVPQQWTLKAIRFDGVDITDQEIDLGEGARQVDIVLTDRISTIRGRVVDQDGTAIGGASVVVFAEDSSLWDEFSRQVQETRTDQMGEFLLRGMPSSNYLAVAIERIPFYAWTNAEVLAGLRPMATRFHLGEGDDRVVSLRVSTPPARLLLNQRAAP